LVNEWARDTLLSHMHSLGNVPAEVMSMTAATKPADMWYVDYDKALSLGLITKPHAQPSAER
jgi:hypothetical protein